MKHIAVSVTFLFIILLTAVELNAQDGFRVYPYLQHPSPEGMTILWFSDRDSAGQLLWGMHPFDPVDSLESDPVAATHLAYSEWEDTTFFEAGAPSFPYRHRIRLEGLEPGTYYNYTVNQGADTFNGSFKTAPMGNDSIRFMVYADSETEPESTGNFTAWIDPLSGDSRPYLLDQTEGYRNNLNIIRTQQPDLVLVAGDLTMHGGEQRDWDEFWKHNTNPESTLSLAGGVPVIAAPGNHDYYEGSLLGQYNQPGSERAINRYLTYFESPANYSPDTEQEGRYYSFQYGPATFISLDLCNNGPNESEEDTNFYLLGESDSAGGHAPDFGPGSPQYLWLEKQLMDAQEQSLFTFIFFHHVPYSSGPHSFPPGSDEFRDNQSGVPVRMLTPLFFQYGVDAVFSGHDEMWERSEVEGTEMLPDGNEMETTLHFYDVGTGGDGLRGPVAGAENPWQKFLVHTDVPEVWEDGVLLDGGKHYGHLQVDIEPQNDTLWRAILTPVYAFPLYNSNDSIYDDYERRMYDDQVILYRTVENPAVSNHTHRSPVHFSKVYPNPFTGQTTIEYGLQEASRVHVIISDVQGRSVRILQEGQQASGSHRIRWDGKDSRGLRVPPGLYHYLIQTGSGNQLSGSMVMVNE